MHPRKSESGRPVRAPLGSAVEFSKNWSAHDIVGKYHIDKIKNPIPIPGSQIFYEREDIKAKEEDRLRFDEKLRQRQAAEQRVITSRVLGATAAVNLHINHVIGAPMTEIEAVLNEKEQELNKSAQIVDSEVAIESMLKNIIQGNAGYIEYAVLTSGFSSFNWTDEKMGNSFVHIAVQHGSISALEELLRYKADPNITNYLGNSPIHDAWYEWLQPPCPPSIQRKQELKTCDILHALLSFNADPDRLSTTDGSTALHIAAKKGPPRAVLTLLFFKAAHDIRNKRGETPLDLAKTHNQHEIVRILSNWSIIRPQIEYSDFKSSWNTFVKDHEIPVSFKLDAGQIIYKMQMRDSMNELQRQSRAHYLINDPLLERSETEAKSSVQPEVQLPWSKKYSDEKTKRFIQQFTKKTANGEHNSQTSVGSELESLADDASNSHVTNARTHHILNYLLDVNRTEKKAPTKSADNRPGLSLTNSFTGMRARRQRAAQTVALDAKFELCTLRPAMRSALLLPIRNSSAPLNGTEEATSVKRYLMTVPNERPTSPPHDDEADEDVVSAKVKKYEAPKSHIGTYLAKEMTQDYTPNQLLYNRLESSAAARHSKKTEALRNLEASTNQLGGEATKDGPTISSLPMLNSRASWLQDTMNPPQKPKTYADLMKEAYDRRQKEYQLLESALGAPKAEGNAEADESHNAIQATANSSPGKPQQKEDDTSPKLGAHVTKSIKYGVGRMKTHHMISGPIEYPWAKISDSYKIS
jgi:hypothetical protein